MMVALLALAALGSVAHVSAAEAPRALFERYKCDVCHADQQAKTGPAYVDVAAKYRRDPQARATLVAEIRKGAHGSGPWHMPPHSEVSVADARTMVGYILSLKH